VRSFEEEEALTIAWLEEEETERPAERPPDKEEKEREDELAAGVLRPPPPLRLALDFRESSWWPALFDSRFSPVCIFPRGFGGCLADLPRHHQHDDELLGHRRPLVMKYAEGRVSVCIYACM